MGGWGLVAGGSGQGWTACLSATRRLLPPPPDLAGLSPRPPRCPRCAELVQGPAYLSASGAQGARLPRPKPKRAGVSVSVRLPLTLHLVSRPSRGTSRGLGAGVGVQEPGHSHEGSLAPLGKDLVPTAQPPPTQVFRSLLQRRSDARQPWLQPCPSPPRAVPDLSLLPHPPDGPSVNPGHQCRSETRAHSRWSKPRAQCWPCLTSCGGRHSTTRASACPTPSIVGRGPGGAGLSPMARVSVGSSPALQGQWPPALQEQLQPPSFLQGGWRGALWGGGNGSGCHADLVKGAMGHAHMSSH